MALSGARARETTTTTGTGTLSLGGAVSGWNTIVGQVGSGKPCFYWLLASDGGYEEGIGTVTDATPDTLSRTTILRSSNSNSALNLPAGTHIVMLAPHPGYGDTAPHLEYISEPTISSGTLTLDLQYNVFKVSHNANITTLAFSNAPASGWAYRGELILTQDATGGRTIALPSGGKTPGGSGLGASTTASKQNRIVFGSEDGFTTSVWHLAGKDYA
jgi:hypothetical protein